jgi:hypothetical protein
VIAATVPAKPKGVALMFSWRRVRFTLLVRPCLGWMRRALGGGRPLFRDRVGSIDMKLVRSESFDRGTVLLTYATA